MNTSNDILGSTSNGTSIFDSTWYHRSIHMTSFQVSCFISRNRVLPRKVVLSAFA